MNEVIRFTKVWELIEALKGMPQGAHVAYVWDGAARSAGICLWLAANGEVMISDGGDVYYDRDRPPGTPDNWLPMTREEHDDASTERWMRY